MTGIDIVSDNFPTECKEILPRVGNVAVMDSPSGWTPPSCNEFEVEPDDIVRQRIGGMLVDLSPGETLGRPLDQSNDDQIRSKSPSVLEEADAIAGQDRSRDYGHPYQNHQRIADLWNAYCKGKGLDARFAPDDVAYMMILLKVARAINGKKRDHLVDIAGYAKCIDMIHDAQAKLNNGLSGG